MASRIDSVPSGVVVLLVGAVADFEMKRRDRHHPRRDHGASLGCTQRLPTPSYPINRQYRRPKPGRTAHDPWLRHEASTYGHLRSQDPDRRLVQSVAPKRAASIAKAALGSKMLYFFLDDSGGLSRAPNALELVDGEHASHPGTGYVNGDQVVDLGIRISGSVACPMVAHCSPRTIALRPSMGFAMAWAERPSNSTPLDGFGPQRDGLLVCH